MTLSNEPMVDIACTVNGLSVRDRVPARQSLVDWIRHGVGLTGTPVGGDQGFWGPCHIVVGGTVVRGCLMLAAQADGEVLETIEGATDTGRLKVLQDAFYERAALQCGFCTPGMILQAAEFLEREPAPSREAIREALSGNYCRCTGYHAIVDAVETAAARLS